MSSPRVDQQSGPLKVGSFYLVPTVFAQWGAPGLSWRSKNVLRAWPVIGPLHSDKEFFNFETDHYHVDARFLPLKDPRVYSTLPYPIHARKPPFAPDGATLPKPVWARRKCIRAGVPDFAPSSIEIDAMRTHYAGRACKRGKAGFICPHRNAPLGSSVPLNGIITCPLHGLRIDAATGVVLPAEVA